MAQHDGRDEMMLKVATTVVALTAAFLAQRALATGWRVVTGHSAPAVDDDDVSIPELITYAAVSAAAVAGVRLLADRRVRRLLTR